MQIFTKLLTYTNRCFIIHTKNETVSRNKGRFPENSCFQLTEEETAKLKMQSTILNLDQGNNWSQIATSSKNENSKHRGKNMFHMFLQNRE